MILVIILIPSCGQQESASEILKKTANAIDTIGTIYYKQKMSRTNPQNTKDTLFRFREMYLKRLNTDSVVGAKGHWYMYIDDEDHVIYEDIYDGSRLIRKNKKDSIARIYDLVKYPDFKKSHFWSHNTPYGMQHEFRYLLDHAKSYSLLRLSDTSINNKNCYQIRVRLEDKTTMPGFAAKLENNEGSITSTLYCIDKESYYPLRMKTENYSTENPDHKVFIDQNYYDIKFNFSIDENLRFNTSMESLEGFEVNDVKPKI